MKRQLLTLATALLTAQFASAEVAEPVEIDAPVEKIFIPVGFDDNDNIEVVVHGKFANTCYQVGKATYTVIEATKEVWLTVRALKYPGPCLQIITPYIKTVTLGIMEAGDYEVKMKNDPGTVGNLPVKVRTTDRHDDYLYAPVANAWLEKADDGVSQVVKVKGEFPFMFVGCMIMDSVEVYRNPADVLVVLPKAQTTDDDAICQKQTHKFEHTVELDKPFKGEGLLHVRVMNGQSFNRFLYFPEL